MKEAIVKHDNLKKALDACFLFCKPNEGHSDFIMCGYRQMYEEYCTSGAGKRYFLKAVCLTLSTGPMGSRSLPSLRPLRNSKKKEQHSLPLSNVIHICITD